MKQGYEHKEMFVASNFVTFVSLLQYTPGLAEQSVTFQYETFLLQFIAATDCSCLIIQ